MKHPLEKYETNIPVGSDIKVVYKERPDLEYLLTGLRLTYNGICDPTLVCVVTARCITEGSYFNSKISATSDKFYYLCEG